MDKDDSTPVAAQWNGRKSESEDLGWAMAGLGCPDTQSDSGPKAYEGAGKPRFSMSGRVYAQ